MNEFSEYFHNLGKRQTSVKLAKVIARNDDGTYTVADIATGSQRRCSKTNPAEEYALNSWVYIGSPTGGRTVIGASDVILSRAPADQKGLSASTPDTVTEGVAGVVISKIVPDPIVLTAGGAAVAASIYGAGFLVGPSYGDPGITDNVAPVITPTRIDVSLIASAPVLGANYPLTVGNTKAPNAIQVIGVPPVFVPLAPTGFVAVNGSLGAPSNIFLSWNPSVGANLYTIRRAYVHGGPYGGVAGSERSVVGTSFSWSDPPFTIGPLHYYVVAASADGGSTYGPDSSEVSATWTA